jgi:hypothetical protein
MGDLDLAITALEDELRWAEKEYAEDVEAVRSYRNKLEFRRQNMMELEQKITSLRRALTALRADRSGFPGGQVLIEHADTGNTEG